MADLIRMSLLPRNPQPTGLGLDAYILGQAHADGPRDTVDRLFPEAWEIVADARGFRDDWGWCSTARRWRYPISYGVAS